MPRDSSVRAVTHSLLTPTLYRPYRGPASTVTSKIRLRGIGGSGNLATAGRLPSTGERVRQANTLSTVTARTVTGRGLGAGPSVAEAARQPVGYGSTVSR